MQKLMIEQREPYIKPGWTQVQFMLVLRETRQKWWFHLQYLIVFVQQIQFVYIHKCIHDYLMPVGENGILNEDDRK